MRQISWLIALCAALWLPGCDNVTQPNQDMAVPDGGGDMAKPTPHDIVVECGAADPAPASGHCAYTASMNGSQALRVRGTVLLPDRVLRNGEVVIDGAGRVACADCRCTGADATDAAVLSCPAGVISPGLINTHDHITYTKIGPVAHADRRYEHRHEWRNGVSGDPERPKITVPGGNNASAQQWGELRHLMGGATSLVGSGGAKGVLRNLDLALQEGVSEGPIDFDTFPLGDSNGKMLATGCGYPKVRPATDLLQLDAYLPHIAEGINDAAENEFRCLSSDMDGGQDLVESRTALIHGVALSAQDARLLSQRRAAVIWSPRSNIDLYGNTAPVPMLDRAGVLVALGTDWSASGSMNLLRELSCAADLNQRYFGSYLTPADLWRMVTFNAALATETQDTLGQLLPGRVADLAIYLGAKERADRVDHLAVVRGEPSDVLLVMRGGLPMYGDAAVLEALGQGEAQGCEALDVCGAQKRLCVQRETGKKLADLETAAIKPIYQMFACGTPPGEPSCVPSRKGQYTGVAAADDADGDGVKDSEDNCPGVFNPVRPVDHGAQPDTDKDGVGDVCDPCPLDGAGAMCVRQAPDDRDADGVPDSTDNCPQVANQDQRDSDMDGVGDACDACAMFSNPYGAPCPFTARELRDPSLGKRPKVGTKVTLKDLLVVGIRAKAGYGFHARDLTGPRDYAGVMVYTGGSAAPKASDGTAIQVGQIVRVSGVFNVFNNTDEVDSPTDLVITGSAPVVPEDVTSQDLLGAPGEKLESLLVRLKSVTMVAKVPPPDAMTMEDDLWVSEDPAETCAGVAPKCARIGDYLLDGNKADGNPAFTAGGALGEVVGVVNGFRDTYSVEIRDLTDIKP